ncbi:MAG: GNAT family N-acetyltransferase [Maricaulaceae bacterium]
MALMRREPIAEGLEGEGVWLRAPRYEDFEAWARLRARSRAFLTPWEPSWPPDDLTRPAFRRRLRRYARDIREGLAYPFFVFRAEDQALAGGCNLSNIRRGVQQTASLGYWVGDPFKRRGLMRAAVTAVLEYAFTDLGLNRIEAACIPCNEPSKALLEALGFRLEGCARRYLKINGAWRDHLLYAKLRGD